MRTAHALLIATLLGACHTGKSPQLRVLGVHDAVAHEVVFVQVSNPAKQAMRLTKLTYTFAAQGGTVATGEMPLRRDVPAGAAVVVEVPIDSNATKPMTLHGVLTAELDQVERTFPVEATVQPGRSNAPDSANGEAAATDASENAEGALPANDEAQGQSERPAGSDATSGEAQESSQHSDSPPPTSDEAN